MLGHTSRRPACAAVCTLLLAATAAAQQFPPPNPKEPFDYVAWLNAGFTRNLKENAADTYLAAVEALRSDDELRTLASEHPETWTEAQRTALRAWVESNAEALAKLAAAAKVEKCYFVVKSEDGSLAEARGTYRKSLRELAQLAMARARLELLAGNCERAVDDMMLVLSLARHLEEQPFIISALVGVGVRHLAYDTLLLVPVLAGDKADFAAIASRLAREDAELRTWQRTIAAEKLSQWDYLQRYVRDSDGDGHYDELSLPPRFAREGTPNARLEPPRTFEELVAPLNTWFERADELFAKPDFSSASPLAQALEAEAESGGDGLLKLLNLGSVGNAARVRFEAVCSRRGTHIVMHLHAHKARTGAWPQNLDEFVPREHAGLTIDPFSGKPLRYELRDGTPLLYSLSRNLKDDDGKPSGDGTRRLWRDEGDFVFWPPPK